MKERDFQNKYFTRAKKAANSILKDRARLQTLLINSTKQLGKLSFESFRFDKLNERLKIIIRMIHAYVSGDYRVPWKSLIVLVAALVYFVTPIDLIPDVIPVTGYLDDFTVVLWVFRTLQSEINDFITWENTVSG